jgi:hypothetical protein
LTTISLVNLRLRVSSDQAEGARTRPCVHGFGLGITTVS